MGWLDDLDSKGGMSTVEGLRAASCRGHTCDGESPERTGSSPEDTGGLDVCISARGNELPEGPCNLEVRQGQRDTSRESRSCLKKKYGKRKTWSV